MEQTNRNDDRNNQKDANSRKVEKSPVNTDKARPLPAGMRPSSIAKDSAHTIDLSPLEKLREDIKSVREIKRYMDDSGAGLRVYSGTGDYLTLEDLVAAIDKEPPAQNFKTTVDLCKKQGVIPLASHANGRVTIGVLATEGQSQDMRHAFSLAEYLYNTLFVRMASVLKLDPKNINLLLLEPKDFLQLEELADDKEKRQKIIRQIDPDASATKIFYSTVHHAIKERASDIHIEPYKDRYRIRFRIDGEMKTRFTINGDTGLPLVSIIMNRSNMRLEEKRKPQDGNIRFGAEDFSVDSIFDGWSMRAAVTPSVDGVGAVLRLLKAARADDFDILKLGLPAKLLERLNEVISAPQGLILVTGPTGSGKTTTLYSILRELNKDNVKILTAEDPVEVNLPGTTQVAVNHKIGLEFPDILRSFLRQDPDIILVGEVRDEDTARTAIQAAMTGHLVFATVHTKDSFGVIPRLEALGVDPERVQSTLSAVVTQRLVRRLCDSCKESYQAASHLKDLFGEEMTKEDITLYKAKDHSHSALGCRDCASTGYLGRRPVVELWVPSEEERALILKGAADSHALAEAADKAGMETMLQSALELVRSGETTIKEVLDRVASLPELRAKKELVRKILGRPT